MQNNKHILCAVATVANCRTARRMCLTLKQRGKPVEIRRIPKRHILCSALTSKALRRGISVNAILDLSELLQAGMRLVHCTQSICLLASKLGNNGARAEDKRCQATSRVMRQS